MFQFKNLRKWLGQSATNRKIRKADRSVRLAMESLEDRKLLSGNEIFVSPGGDDWNNGSQNQPFQTIRRALDAATPGDTITLRNGVYQGGINIDIDNLTIRSMPGEWAVVEAPLTEGQDGLSSSVFRYSFDTNGGKLQNLEITGGYYYGVMFWDWWDSNTGAGTVHTGASNITLEGCKIHDTGVDAVKITPGANDISVINCEIYNTGRRSTTSSDGIDNNNGDRMIARGNFIHDIPGVGILTSGGSVDSLIEQNLVQNTRGAGINVGYYSELEWMEPDANPNLYTSLNNIARNNIIVNAAHAGIGIYSSLNPQVYNNTIVHAASEAQAPIQFGGVDIWVSNYSPDAHIVSVNPMVLNNIIESNNETRMVDIREGSYSGVLTLDNNLYHSTGLLGARFIDRNVLGDAAHERTFSQWKNLEGHDLASQVANPLLDASWHLSAGSPAIAKAIAIAGMTNDIDGNPRAGTFDAGADQFGAGSNKVLPPAAYGAPAIEIAERAYHDYEGKTIQVKVVRHGQTTDTVTVLYSTIDGTAKNGPDYHAVSGMLTFAPGETEKIVTVTLYGDTLAEGDEHFLFTLTNPTTDGTLPVRLGHQSASSMTIDDEDTPLTLNYRTLWVSPTGSDFQGDGSAAKPWKSLQHAAEQVGPGDYVIVLPGQYQGMYMTNDGKADARITFHAMPGVEVNEANPVNNLDGLNLEGADYVTIEGFNVHDMPRAGLRSVLNQGVILRENVSDHNTFWGILTGWSEGIIVENNVTSHSVKEHGIYISNSADDAIVRNNISFGNRCAGIQFNADGGLPGDGVHSRNLIEGNLIYDNGVGGGGAINLDAVQDSIIRNNLLFNNHATGIVLYVGFGAEPSTNNLVENNTVVNASDSRYALLMWNGSSGNTIVNNVLISGNPVRGSMSVESTSLPAYSDHNILQGGFELDGYSANFAAWQQFSGGKDANSMFVTANDLFVDPANHDFHLKANSPALNAGDSNFTPMTDIYGHARPQNGTVDIGAFEAGSFGSSVQFDWSNYIAYETGGMAEITVTRTGSTEGTLTVNYSTSAGTASSADFANAMGTLTFSPGQTKKTFVVFVTDDPDIEDPETINMMLSSPTLNGVADNGLLGQSSATLNIISDDAWKPGKVQFDSKSVTVNEAAGTVEITVNRVDGSSGAIAVDYQTALYVPGKVPTWYNFHTLPLYEVDNATPATAGEDFVPVQGTLTFADGETSKTISLPILNDGWYEKDEALLLKLSNPTNGAALGSIAQTKVRIESEDIKQPGKFLFSTPTYEVTEGTPSISIVVKRIEGANTDADVRLYYTGAGNGSVGSAWDDYGSIPEILHFARGETEKTIVIPILDDANTEGDEAFSIQLYSPSNDAMIGNQPKTVVTIHDNESTLYFQGVNGASSFNVDEGAGNAQVKVYRQGSLATPATVRVKTGETWGSAKAGVDFTPVDQLLTFLPGEAFKIVNVPIINDALVESTESLPVMMSDVTGATQGSWSWNLNINDDDQALQAGKFTFGAPVYQVMENGGAITVTVYRTDGSAGTATVKYTTSDGPTLGIVSTAYAGYNYTKAAGTLTFAPGETQKTIVIPITDNTGVNPDKNFTVTLSSPTGGALLGAVKSTVVTIVNDDSKIEFGSSMFQASENDGWVTITVVRHGATFGTASVDLAVSNWAQNQWTDFVKPASLKVEFAAGESTKEIKLQVIDDLFKEGEEWFNIGLSNVQGAQLDYLYYGNIKLLDND